MQEGDKSRATLLLRRLGRGDEEVAAELLEMLYGELHGLARAQMRDQASGHTLQPTALVHEAWMRLVDQQGVDWENRAQFFSLAARAMRSILIDHSRKKNAQKRGGNRSQLPLDDALLTFEERSCDMIALDDALTRLAGFDEQAARIVDLRFFGGLSHEDISHLLEVSTRTVERSWRMARTWLHQELAADVS